MGFKTVKSFSLSVFILIIFYVFAFGFIFGTVSANQTYKKNLETYNIEHNTEKFIQQIRGRGYDDSSKNSKYLTKDYWDFYVKPEEFPDNWFKTYKEESTWKDFSHQVEPYYWNNPMPTQNNDEFSTWMAFNSINGYLDLFLWNYIYHERLNDSYEFYYKFDMNFETTARKNSSSSYFNYKTLNFLSFNDLYVSDKFYPTESDVPKEEQAHYLKTWNEVETTDSIFQKTNKSNDENYYVNKYIFTDFWFNPKTGKQSNADDLLAYNDQDKILDIKDGVIQVAVDQDFFKENDLIFGEKYSIELSSSEGYQTYTFQPIATFTDSNSFGQTSSFEGSILLNSYDFSRLAWNDYFSNGILSTNFKINSYIHFQAEELLNSYTINDQINVAKYNKFMNTKLSLSIKQYNEWIFQSVFKNNYEVNPNGNINSLNDLTQNQIDQYERLIKYIDFNSIRSYHSYGYYENNSSSSISIYIQLLISILIAIILILIVLYIMFSILNKKIKDNYQQFGLLKSFGYKTSVISISFLSFPLILILISNFFAIIISFLFFHLVLSKLLGIFAITITKNFFLKTIFFSIIVSAIILLFSYIKIKKSLKISELTLLNGKDIYSPGFIFIKAAKIGDKFKSFENSYAFKNIFKSFSKSTMILSSVFACLFLFSFSFTIISFVKINTEENLKAYKFEEYSNLNYRSWGSWENNKTYSSMVLNFKSIYDYKNNPFIEDQQQAFLDEVFLLGDYNFGLVTNNFSSKLAFDEKYDKITSTMFRYISSHPIVQRNNSSIFNPEIKDKYNLFDYSYISRKSSLKFLTTYLELYISYLNSINYNISISSFDFPSFEEPGFLINGKNQEKITFSSIYNLIFKKTFISWFYSNFILSTNTNNLSSINDFENLFLSSFPIISFGRTVYNPDFVTLISRTELLINKNNIKNSLNQENVNFIILKEKNDFRQFFDVQGKGSSNIYDLFENEVPNSEYIPVLIDEGQADYWNLKVGDFIFGAKKNNSHSYLKNFKFKVVGIVKNADISWITSLEFFEYFPVKPVLESIMTTNENISKNYISPIGFYSPGILDNLTYKQGEGIFLFNHGKIFSDWNLQNLNSTPFSSPVTRKQIVKLSELTYGFITKSFMFMAIIIMIIPLLLITISIKEVIDDNIKEVSSLKAFGYNTFKTSKLILSPYLVTIFLSFILIIPASFILFALLHNVFLTFLALDLTFKMLAWQWLIIILLDLIIMFLLFAISYYYYYRIKSKIILKNIN